MSVPSSHTAFDTITLKVYSPENVSRWKREYILPIIFGTLLSLCYGFYQSLQSDVSFSVVFFILGTWILAYIFLIPVTYIGMKYLCPVYISMTVTFFENYAHFQKHRKKGIDIQYSSIISIENLPIQKRCGLKIRTTTGEYLIETSLKSTEIYQLSNLLRHYSQ